FVNAGVSSPRFEKTPHERPAKRPMLRSGEWQLKDIASAATTNAERDCVTHFMETSVAIGRLRGFTCQLIYDSLQARTIGLSWASPSPRKSRVMNLRRLWTRGSSAPPNRIDRGRDRWGLSWSVQRRALTTACATLLASFSGSAQSEARLYSLDEAV